MTEGDADTTIVRCVVNKAASEDNVAIIGKDTDLLDLLRALVQPIKKNNNNNIFFIKPRRRKVETNYLPWRYKNWDSQKVLSSFTRSVNATTPHPFIVKENH